MEGVLFFGEGVFFRQTQETDSEGLLLISKLGRKHSPYAVL